MNIGLLSLEEHAEAVCKIVAVHLMWDTGSPDIMHSAASAAVAMPTRSAPAITQQLRLGSVADASCSS